MSSGIVFQVETGRVLQILAREIYDSPLALLRENTQNAYDAVRMRFAGDGPLAEGGRIDITIGDGQIVITDNGIGMDERTLRENFWRAGSSGKHSDIARRAGVVGTFGIGAMANFGACTRLTVDTRTEGATETLHSVAELASLKIGEECIQLKRTDAGRPVGTTVTATLSSDQLITPAQATQYLDSYVGLLPVPVYLNETLISGATIESRMAAHSRSFTRLGSKTLEDSLCGATFDVHVDPNGQVLVYVSNISLAGALMDGSLALLQSGGALMGLRSLFGLAPIPAAGLYQFGGYANMASLQPTAGREALNRESIDQVSRLLTLAERATSELLADTTAADRNTAFMQWLISHGRYELGGRISVRALPDDIDIPLCEVRSHAAKQSVHFYAGTDKDIIRTFASESSCLLLVAQNNPRREVQLHYLQHTLSISPAPMAPEVLRIYKGAELTWAEASVVLWIGSILRQDYLVPDVDVCLADISHGVTILPQGDGDKLTLHLSRSSPLLPPLLEFREKAHDVFTQLMKDFVGVQLYPKITPFVPSSTREGVDALRRLLERNRELYRIAEDERGDLEGVLGDYLAGVATFADVLDRARTQAHVQSQTVSPEQVGSIEAVVPDVVGSPVTPSPGENGEFAAAPPIVRDEVTSEMKILTSQTRHAQLNNFTMLLGLSDALMRTEAEFFRSPHTTRILWGGQRIIYIFTEATGRLSLYYNVQLRTPLEGSKTGGGMFATTTLITRRRIFVPVPDTLVAEFTIRGAPKEFLVTFDLLG